MRKEVSEFDPISLAKVYVSICAPKDLSFQNFRNQCKFISHMKTDNQKGFAKGPTNFVDGNPVIIAVNP